MSARYGVKHWSARDRTHAVCAFVVPCALALLAYAWSGERGSTETAECLERYGHAIEHARQPESVRDSRCASPE